jgi:hypothetical protein
MAGGKKDTRSREDRRKETGEDFTPPDLVEEILDRLPPESWSDPTKLFLDPSCGDGNFLVAVKKRLLEAGHSEESVLARILGIDIMHDNVVSACKRLGLEFDPSAPLAVSRTVVCADTMKHAEADELFALFAKADAEFQPVPEDKWSELKSHVTEIKKSMRSIPKGPDRDKAVKAYKNVVRLIKELS